MTAVMLAMTLFAISVVVLLVGLGLGIWVVVRPRRGAPAASILEERFARGEISADEYHERRSTLEAASWPERSRTKLVSVAILLVVIGIVGTAATGVGAANSSWDWMGELMDGDMGSMMSMMQSGPSERIGDAPDPEATTTRVTSREFSFSPAEISARSGETINVEFTNAGHMFHTLTISDLDLDLRARSGATVTGAITPEKPGTYEFICTVPQHADMGMRGRIIVSSG